MRNSRGFTLIELAVTLAVVAILAAVLTPLVTQYVDEARTVKALAEARSIAMAILLFQRDTSKFPVFNVYTSPTTDVELLFGPGIAPSFSGDDWLDGFIPLSDLQTRVNTNFFTLPTTYGGGHVAYHGPYTAGLTPDPWGRQYLAEVGTAPGTIYAAFVMSAGPDGIVQTIRVQPIATFTVAGDDIVARIR